MQNQDEKIVIFSDNTAPIISEILRKYNLNESLEEMIKTMENKKYFRGGIVLQVVEKIVLNKGSKSDLVLMLKNGLNISDELADKMAEDIKNRLLSIAKIYSPSAPQPVAPQPVFQKERIGPKRVQETKKPFGRPDNYREPIE